MQIKLNMKRHILLLGFLLMMFGLQLDAQTIKNIHRHNLPVLQIPVNLIDKVETIDVAGQKYLHVIQLSGFVNEVPVAQIDSITHTDGTALDPSQLGNLRTASVMGIVSGPTGAPEMNAIVRSPYGSEETRTDQNGVFFLNNILVYDKLGFITITKPGFHQGSRSFLPLETGSNRVNVQLLPMTQSVTFNAANGGTVTSGLLQLNFPANAVTLNDQPYTGTVRVFAQTLNPTSTAMFDQMPGELLGGMNDSLRILRSFGMASIELRDANMNELQLADGVSATLTFNIPASLQAEAPQTIDWWSFDEVLGYWKHEGVAQRQGNSYVGQASHFSWWNCDVPANFNDLIGNVNTVDGTPISDAQINVVTPNLGTGITYTNTEGGFTGRVPKNQLLTLNILLTCETTNDWNLVYSEEFSSANEPIFGQYEPASLDERFPIVGIVVTCEGIPVESGYLKMGAQIFLTENGNFTIQTCQTGEYSFRGFNTSNPDSIKVGEMVTIQVDSAGIDIGELEACEQIYGSVMDIDGNTYLTVLIGNQRWMAENLRTTNYSNGEPIPNVTDIFDWGGLNSGAWCNYNNDASNDVVYGKLYNWYTTVDSRGLCPTGWHVPTDGEWTILTDELGGLMAGGKMKSLTLWNAPNTGATNESGFSGLPGGMHTNLNFTIGNVGLWFSSSENTSNLPWYRMLNNNNTNVTRDVTSKTVGYSIRCLKD